MIECEICKKQFKRITMSHLRFHGMTTSEYITLFPNANTISPELRHAYGNAFRTSNPMHNIDSKNKVIGSLIGKPKTEEHKEKLSLVKIGKSWGSHTEEHKTKMVEISRKNMLYRLKNGWKQPEWSAEQKLAHSKRMLGNKNGKNGNHNKGTKLNLSDEQKLNRSLKRSDYLSKNKTKSSFTKIEQACAEFLSKNKIDFVSQFILVTTKCSWVFDFYVPSLNLLIEVDGEFWHSKPKQINRDKLKTAAAKEHGYKLLRLSDLDLKFELIFKEDIIIEDWSNNVLGKRTSS